MRWILLTLVLGCAARAQNVRVTKVSGKKAIVERESGPPLKVGMLLTAGGDEFGEADLDEGAGAGKARSAGSRNNTLGGGVSLSTTSTDTSSTTFGLGGFFDFNFQPNVPGAEMVWAAGATADWRNSSTSPGSSDTSTIDFFIGPALKWFPLGNSVAVRLDAGLDYARSTSGTVTTTATTFLAHVGLQVYF